MTLREILTRLWERVCPRVTLYEERNTVANFGRKHTAGWTDEDERREADLYATNPLAFWLRPDRHEHGVPCWMVEGEYQPPARPQAFPYDFVTAQSLLLAQQQAYSQQAQYQLATQNQLANLAQNQQSLQASIMQNHVLDAYASMRLNPFFKP